MALRIGTLDGAVTLTSNARGVVVVSPLQVGRLRAALRDAVLEQDAP